jgi:putative transposase
MPFTLSPRLKAFDYRGLHRYFVTICCDRRKRLLTTRPDVEMLLSQLRRTAIDEQFDVIAYCFMPDHVHLLVQGASDTSDLKEFLRIFKQRSGFSWTQATGRPLWQRGYFEHVLRGDEDTLNAARYVLANPVRAGLTTSPSDYPFLGSLTMKIKELIGSVQID